MTVTRAQLELDPVRLRWRSIDAVIFLGYYGLFMAYNFVARETEPLHWVSLVLFPLAIVYGLTRMVYRGDLGDALAHVLNGGQREPHLQGGDRRGDRHGRPPDPGQD